MIPALLHETSTLPVVARSGRASRPASDPVTGGPVSVGHAEGRGPTPIPDVPTRVGARRRECARDEPADVVPALGVLGAHVEGTAGASDAGGEGDVRRGAAPPKAGPRADAHRKDRFGNPRLTYRPNKHHRSSPPSLLRTPKTEGPTHPCSTTSGRVQARGLFPSSPKTRRGLGHWRSFREPLAALTRPRSPPPI